MKSLKQCLVNSKHLNVKNYYNYYYHYITVVLQLFLAEAIDLNIYFNAVSVFFLLNYTRYFLENVQNVKNIKEEVKVTNNFFYISKNLLLEIFYTHIGAL